MSMNQYDITTNTFSAVGNKKRGNLKYRKQKETFGKNVNQTASLKEKIIYSRPWGGEHGSTSILFRLRHSATTFSSQTETYSSAEKRKQNRFCLYCPPDSQKYLSKLYQISWAFFFTSPDKLILNFTHTRFLWTTIYISHMNRFQN